MNPFLGVFFHWLGGLASGSFYVPYKGVKKWSWETYWLVGGVFSWIICPWLLASVLTNDLFGVLKQQSASTLWWTYFFGAMWGLGGLTFGLTMRYLGMSLGMGVALGYCAAFGTLLLPILKEFFPTIRVAETITQIASTNAGKITIFGVFICLLGIAIAAYAGLTKEAPQVKAAAKWIASNYTLKVNPGLGNDNGLFYYYHTFAKAMDALGVPLEDPVVAEVNPVIAASGWTPGQHSTTTVLDGDPPGEDSIQQPQVRLPSWAPPPPKTLITPALFSQPPPRPPGEEGVVCLLKAKTKIGCFSPTSAVFLVTP